MYKRQVKGSETLYAQVFDGEAWSAWGNWTQQTIRTTNTVSVVSAANKTVAQNDWLRSTALGIVVTDADGDTPEKYRITDVNTAANSARMYLGGGYLDQGATVTVSAADWNGFYVQGASAGATDQFTVQIFDGYEWSNLASFNVETPRTYRAPVVTNTGTRIAHIGESYAAGGLFSYSDPDGDSAVTYRFWDSTLGGGTFYLNGIAQDIRTNIDVSAADLSKLTFRIGTSTSDVRVTDSLSMQAFDGHDWSAWSTFSLTTYLPLPSGVVKGTYSNDTISAGYAETPSVYYGGPGNDLMYSSVGFNVLVGGEGDDTYHIDRYPTVTFIYDADGGSNTLSMPNSLVPATRNSVGLIAGRHLVLADDSGRTVIVIDWKSGRNNIGRFTNSYNGPYGIDWNAAQINAQFNAALTGSVNGISVVSYTWESLGFATADINAAIAKWEAGWALQSPIDKMMPFAKAPSDFAIRGLAAGGEAVNSSDASLNKTMIFGRGGGDSFNLQGSLSNILLGGGGDDAYTSSAAGLTIIYDGGNSAGDSLVLKAPADLANYAMLVDGGRHLMIRNETSGATILLDWKDAANRLESIKLGSTTYTYDQFVALVSSTAIPQATWTQLGANKDNWDYLISQLQTRLGYANQTLTPVMNTTNETSNKGSNIPLNYFLHYGDPNGPGITEIKIFDASGAGKIFRYGVDVTPAAGETLYLAPGDISGCYVTTTASGQSFSFWATAGDGWETSAPAQATLTAYPNVAPVVTPHNQSALLGASVKIDGLFTWSDANAQNDLWSYYTFEISNLQGGARIDEFGVTKFSTGDTGSWSGVKNDRENALLVVPSNGATPVTFQVRVTDGVDWSDWATVTLATRASNAAPVITAVPKTYDFGTSFSLASLFNTNDADGDTIVNYRLTGATGYQNVLLNGGTINSLLGTPYVFTAASLSQYTISPVNALPAATFTAYLEAYDGIAWGAPVAITAAGPAYVPPVINTTPGQAINAGTRVSLSSLFNVTVDSHWSVTRYKIGGLSVAGTFSSVAIDREYSPGNTTSYITDSSNVIFTAAMMSTLSFVVPTHQGAMVSFTLDADIGQGFGNPTTISVATANGTNSAPMVDLLYGANQAQIAGSTTLLALSPTVFPYYLGIEVGTSSAQGNGNHSPVFARLYDSDDLTLSSYEVKINNVGANSGYFTLTTDPNTHLTDVVIDGSHSYLYHTADSYNFDALSVRGNDGLAWGEWAQFNVAAVPGDTAGSDPEHARHIDLSSGATTQSVTEWVGNLDYADIFIIDVASVGQGVRLTLELPTAAGSDTYGGVNTYNFATHSYGSFNLNLAGGPIDIAATAGSPSITVSVNGNGAIYGPGSGYKLTATLI